MKSYEELLAENEALTAQVERLTPLARRCMWGALVWNDHNFGDLRGYLKEETHKAGILDIDEANELLGATPQQCLAEIKAEAGKAGFIAGYHKMHIEFVGSLASGEGAEFAANQYADKIRNTGTWLKDSNVNGGKRQGGAK